MKSYKISTLIMLSSILPVNLNQTLILKDGKSDSPINRKVEVETEGGEYHVFIDSIRVCQLIMQTVKPLTEKNSGPDLSNWNQEDENQWSTFGKNIAFRNLWVSVPCLLCGFAVWMYWGVITVQMLNLGFPYSKEQFLALLQRVQQWITV